MWDRFTRIASRGVSRSVNVPSCTTGEKTGRNSSVPRSVRESGSCDGSSSSTPDTLNGVASSVTS